PDRAHRRRREQAKSTYGRSSSRVTRGIAWFDRRRIDPSTNIGLDRRWASSIYTGNRASVVSLPINAIAMRDVHHGLRSGGALLLRAGFATRLPLSLTEAALSLTAPRRVAATCRKPASAGVSSFESALSE